MKNAIISVKSFQYIDDDEGVVELKTTGKYGIKNDKHYILYEEIDESGGKTDTMIKLSSTEAVLQRSGALENRMVVEVGKRHSSLYSTPMGSFFIDVYGESIKSTLSESGGTLSLIYSLNMNTSPVGKNRIEITVKEV